MVGDHSLAPRAGDKGRRDQSRVECPGIIYPDLIYRRRVRAGSGANPGSRRGRPRPLLGLSSHCGTVGTNCPNSWSFVGIRGPRPSQSCPNGTGKLAIRSEGAADEGSSGACRRVTVSGDTSVPEISPKGKGRPRVPLGDAGDVTAQSSAEAMQYLCISLYMFSLFFLFQRTVIK